MQCRKSAEYFEKCKVLKLSKNAYQSLLVKQLFIESCTNTVKICGKSIHSWDNAHNSVVHVGKVRVPIVRSNHCESLPQNIIER